MIKALIRASMYNASHSYVKISVQWNSSLELSWWSQWDRERDAEHVEQGDARNRIENRIENRCFRTLILKLVNPLESLEDRIAIHSVYE